MKNHEKQYPLTLFHSPGTRSIRVFWLLEELGLSYDLKSYKYDSKYFASSEFRAINPMGKVPALYDGEQLIIESTAIMEYLLNNFGPNWTFRFLFGLFSEMANLFWL